MIAPDNGRGAELCERLGIPILGREGHDLKAACPYCGSSDALRIHSDTGVAFCYSCQAKASRLELAEKYTGDRTAAWSALVAAGLEQPQANGNHHANGNGTAGPTLLERVAKLKGVTVEALERYGAKMEGGHIVFPMYGPDGKQCSTFKLGADGGKGMNEKGKKSGVLLPHNDDGTPRLPQPGETWHVVEGVKDAAALFALGLLACGLPGSAMAVKFARLFIGCNVILIPDRDKAGVDGAEKSAARIYGGAESVRIATLPAEFKESKGADVRDVLKQAGGRELVLQAITDAKPWAPQVVNAANQQEGSLWAPDGRTDIANARRFAAEYGENIRWCELWNCWERYDGKRWVRDASCKLYALAKRYAEKQWREITAMLAKADRETATALVAFGRRTASANGLRDLLTVARSEPNIPIAPDVHDRDPFLFNVENGTIDLRTGELRPHRRDDMLTKLAPVKFNPDADCPLWRASLKRNMAGNDRLIAFLRRLVGYSMTGLAREHVLAFLYGTGANGKSLFLNALLALFGGDYGMKAAPELLMVKRGESHPCDRADLFGRRLVCCIEVCRTAAAWPKAGWSSEMTGGDKITRAVHARELFRVSADSHNLAGGESQADRSRRRRWNLATAQTRAVYRVDSQS